MHTHSKIRRCALSLYTFMFWTKNPNNPFEKPLNLMGSNVILHPY